MVQSVRSSLVRRRRVRLAVAAATASILLAGAAPAVAATPAPVVEPVVVGSLTWSFAQEVPAARAQAIAWAMDEAVNAYNTVARYSGDVTVSSDETAATARTGYRGTIVFGRSISPGVAQHELGRWLGVGTLPEFRGRVVNGLWTGAVGTAYVHSYDGWQARVHSDGADFWPYGWNSSAEYGSPQRQIGLVSGLRADMGLSDGSADAAGTYRVQNRANGRLISVNTAGSDVLQKSSSATAPQRWVIEPRNGVWLIRSTETGLVVDTVGRRGDGARVAFRPQTAVTTQLWEAMPTEGGWFQLRNQASGTCLDTAGLGAGTVLQVWACGAPASQQWRLARG